MEPAYLISKALRKLAKPKFIIAVPRRAKSAATLLAFGADEIHMGLMSKLDLQELGFFKRVTESAEQYAERLQQNKELPEGQTARSIAEHFVNYHKDHGFVIDIEEARALLGDSIIRESTPEYEFSDAVCTLFYWLDILFGILRQKSFACIGMVPSGVSMHDLPNE